MAGKTIRIGSGTNTGTPMPVSNTPTPLVESSGASLNLSYTHDYIFTGSENAVWNLPDIDANKKGRDYQIAVKNNGTNNATVTIPSNGLIDGAANIILPSGYSVTIFPTGTAFTLINTNT